MAEPLKIFSLSDFYNIKYYNTMEHTQNELLCRGVFSGHKYDKYKREKHVIDIDVYHK